MGRHNKGFPPSVVARINAAIAGEICSPVSYQFYCAYGTAPKFCLEQNGSTGMITEGCYSVAVGPVVHVFAPRDRPKWIQFDECRKSSIAIVRFKPLAEDATVDDCRKWLVGFNRKCLQAFLKYMQSIVGKGRCAEAGELG